MSRLCVPVLARSPPSITSKTKTGPVSNQAGFATCSLPPRRPHTGGSSKHPSSIRVSFAFPKGKGTVDQTTCQLSGQAQSHAICCRHHGLPSRPASASSRPVASLNDAGGDGQPNRCHAKEAWRTRSLARVRGDRAASGLDHQPGQSGRPIAVSTRRGRWRRLIRGANVPY